MSTNPETSARLRSSRGRTPWCAGVVCACLSAFPPAQTATAAGVEFTQLAAAVVQQRETDQKESLTQGRVDQALRLLGKKEFDKALSEAKHLIQAYPDDPRGFALQGGAYLGKNDLASAKRSFAQALERSPRNVPVLINLGQIELAQGDFAGARTRFQAVLSADPANLTAMFGMVKAASVEKNDADALMWLERAKKAHPDSEAATILLSEHYLARGEPVKAVDEMEAALRARPDRPALLDVLARAQLAANRVRVAEKTYLRLTQISPNSARAHIGLAGARMAARDHRSAEKSVAEALRLEPRNVEALLLRGTLDLYEGRVAEALKRSEEVQKLAETSPGGYTLAGDALSRMKKFQPAVQAYEKAWARGQSGALAIRLHAARAAAGQGASADEQLVQWVDAHAGDSRARGYLAEVYLRSGRATLAVAQYERLVRDEPRNLVFVNNLALAYHAIKDNRALATAEEAMKLGPDSPGVADTLGWILVEGGNLVRGLELLRNASKRAPENPEIRYHYAVALARSGEKAAARKEFEALLASSTSFPQRENARSLLKTLQEPTK